MIAKFKTAKEKEQQGDTIKRPKQDVLIFFQKKQL